MPTTMNPASSKRMIDKRAVLIATLCDVADVIAAGKLWP